MLDEAFEALKTFDWGTDRAALAPIDEAARTSRDTARAELESRLVTALQSELSRDAKDFLCRTLMQVGTAASAPALGGLLAQPELSHMARYALERMPASAASDVLRANLATLEGALLVGVIGSLGARRDAASVNSLGKLLASADAAVARAAACALGQIGTPEADRALAGAAVSAEIESAIADARLATAERLLADGNKTAALAIYKAFVGQDRPKHVRLAGTRGMLACAGKKE